MITCRYFKMNYNDAFSAMRLDSYRNFSRIRIKGDEVTIYPVWLDKRCRHGQAQRRVGLDLIARWLASHA
jgi:hypothetical protein